MTDINQTTAPATQPERIGRYAHSELAAMSGKRGRKPPEYYELFPEQRREPAPPKAEKQRASKKSKASAAAAPVDNDALAAQVRASSPPVRKLISDLLAVVGQPAAAAAPVEAQTVTISEPVYADPEGEADVEQADPALAG